jgi:uncharacterized protein YjiS (DUF1127 family)
MSQRFIAHRQSGGPAASLAQFGSSLAAAAIERLLLWQERARGRRALAALSDARLKDIGLSRGAAFEEVQKPFWRA